MDGYNGKYIQFSLDNSCLRLMFPERINTDNASEIKKELDELLSLCPHSELIADFDRVEYISSIGLRIILELIRKEKNFSIIRVAQAPYEVFEMTGFLSMTNIQKKPRRISLEGAKEIGWGYSSRVYQLNEDTIVKVYIDSKFTEHIEKELRNAKQAFIAGIPTAISYDIVEVGECCGVVFEMMNGCLLRDAMAAEPERFEEYMDMYIHVLQTMNMTPVTDPLIPDIKDEVRQRIAYLANGIFTPDEAEQMERFISSLPDTGTYIHGDCHIKNIMLSNGEPMLIDMESLSKGSPLFELGALYNPYIAFEEAMPGNNLSFLGINAELTRQIADTVMKRCLPLYSSEPYEHAIETVRMIGYFQALYIIARFYSDDLPAVERAKQLFRAQLAKLQ